MKFRVGDVVVTSSGKTGTIYDIDQVGGSYAVVSMGYVEYNYLEGDLRFSVQPELKPFVPPPAQRAEPERAMRSSTGKPQLSYMLCFPRAMEGIARISEYGAEKYDLYDFKKGAPLSQSIRSGLRHLMKHWNGEDIDPETGENHLHAANWNFTRAADELTGPLADELDDRPHRVLARRAMTLAGAEKSDSKKSEEK